MNEQGQRQAVRRPIQRADEAAVRALLPPEVGNRLYFMGDRIAFRLPDRDSAQYDEMVETLTRAGIMTGAKGWEWTEPATPIDEPEILHTIVCNNAGGENYDCADYPIDAAPPAWLLDAVLGALSPDGTPLAMPRIRAALSASGVGVQDADIGRALSALIIAEEVELHFGEDPAVSQWRRWDVPKGWEIRDETDAHPWRICAVGDEDMSAIATVDSARGGHWIVYDGKSTRILLTGDAPTLDAAKRAALRACWEMGLFGGTVPPAPIGGTFLDVEGNPIPPSTVPFSPLLSACIEIARAVTKSVKSGASDYSAIVRAALGVTPLEDFLDEFKRFDGGRPLRFLGVAVPPRRPGCEEPWETVERLARQTTEAEQRADRLTTMLASAHRAERACAAALVRERAEGTRLRGLLSGRAVGGSR